MWSRDNAGWQEPAPFSHDAGSDKYFMQENFNPNNHHYFTSQYASEPPSAFPPNFNSPAMAADGALTMPDASQTKLNLGARAAELKEKLLKSRGQSQSRASPASPAPPSTSVAKPSTNAPVDAPSTTPTLSGPSAERVKPSSHFVPHEVPQPRAMTSLPADANDIAALISSISSAADESPSLTSTSTNGSSNDAQRNAPIRHALPPKPVPKISIPTTAAAMPQATQSAKQPAQQTLRAVIDPASTPIKARTPATESPEEGEVTKTTASNGKTTTAAVPAEQTTPGPTDHKDRKSPVARVGSAANGHRSVHPPNINSRAGSAREKTDPAFIKPSLRGPPLDREIRSHIVAPKLVAAIEPAKGVHNGIAADQRTTSGSGGHSKPTSPDDAFNRLLNQAPDLKDFLEMTDYYNVETRTRKLDRFRRVKALAAQRLKIEEEERRLVEEEELELGIHRSSVARFTSAMPGTPAGTETNSLPTPITPMPIAATSTIGIKNEPSTNPAKRAHDEDGAEVRQEKVPRLEAPRSRNIDKASQENNARDAPTDTPRGSQSDKADSRPRVPRDHPSSRRPRSPSPRRDDRYHRSPSTRPRYRDDNDYDDHRHKYDRYKGDGGRYHHSERRLSYPVHVDLGRKGDTRFFIVKSFNEENVRRCMDDGLWTTQVQNGEILAEAYAKCKNVILFFSINKSRAFQGYARMASAPSPDIPRPTFVKGIHWDTSDPFRVEWLSKTAVEFFRIGHLKNPYNEHMPVLVGKDGQEIEPECGAGLLREMEIVAEAGGGGGEGGFAPKWGGNQNHRHYGNSRKWVKREEERDGERW